METTPAWFLSFCLVLIGSYGALLGLEVIARSAQFVLPLFILCFLGVILLGLKDIDVQELLPLLEGGVSPILKAAITPAAWFGECIILAFLLPSINKPKEVFQKGSWAIWAAVIILLGDILFSLLILGTDLTASLNLPFYIVIRYLEVGRTFLRIETVLIFLWTAVLVVKFTLIYYLGSVTVTYVFGWKSYKRVVFVIAFVLTAASGFLVTSTMELSFVLEVLWPPFALFFELVVPVFLLIVAWLRQLKRR